jgi:hypothetical protein
MVGCNSKQASKKQAGNACCTRRCLGDWGLELLYSRGTWITPYKGAANYASVWLFMGPFSSLSLSLL